MSFGFIKNHQSSFVHQLNKPRDGQHHDGMPRAEPPEKSYRCVFPSVVIQLQQLAYIRLGKEWICFESFNCSEPTNCTGAGSALLETRSEVLC